MDGDGKLSWGEFKNWRINGNGKTIEVNASKIDIGSIESIGRKIGEEVSIDFIAFTDVMFSTGAVYGHVNLIYQGSNNYSIKDNMADTEIGAAKGHPWNSPYGVVRNIFTFFDKVLTGGNKAKDFMVTFTGVATAHPINVKLQGPFNPYNY